MIRENLSAIMPCEQMALSTFERASALSPKSQMAVGMIRKGVNHQEFTITNKELITQRRLCEFLKTLERFSLEFPVAEETEHLFKRLGAKGNEDVWELYLEQDNLSCNYCFQVHSGQNEPFFVKIFAYAKDIAPHRHHH